MYMWGIVFVFWREVFVRIDVPHGPLLLRLGTSFHWGLVLPSPSTSFYDSLLLSNEDSSRVTQRISLGCSFFMV